MMKQKLLIFHPYLATYRVDLYNRFTYDFDVKVLLTGSQQELDTLGFDLQKVNALAEFDYIYFQASKYIGRHPLSSVFYKTIKEFRPNIVLAHEYGINTLAAIAHKSQFKYKLFITCDDNVQMAQEYSWKRKLLRKFVVRQVDGIITVSSSTQKYLQNRFKATRHKFHYFPIIQNDIILHSKVAHATDLSKEYIGHYNLQDKHVLLFVGRLEPVKCIDTIIQAFKNSSRKNCKLIIVGSGSLEKTLKDMVKFLDLEEQVQFIGPAYEEKLYAWYNIADTFVLASNREAFGAVVNEALVSGCRCIVSDHWGAYTLITENNGTVFECGNIDQLQSCIEKEIKIGKKRTVSSLMPQSFEELYKSLISNF